MELESIWKKLEAEKLEVVQPTRLVEWPPRTKHPVKKLERAFLTALLFSAFFEGIFVYLFTDFSHILVRSFLALVIIAYVFFFVINYRVYRDIRKEVDFSKDLHTTLSTIYTKVDQALRFQRRAALYIYPVAASTGFLVGFASEKNPDRVLQEPWLMAVMIGVSILLTPAGYYLARWMEKVSYEKYCEQLKSLIAELERPERQLA